MRTYEEMVRRQKALGEFCEFALQSGDLDEVLTQACRIVAEVLGTGRAKVLAMQENGASLFVRAGVGWEPNIVGRLRLPMDEHSSEFFAVSRRKPVIMRDLRQEERFVIPAFMKDAGVLALANVPIFLPARGAYGLLQVDATEPRGFDQEDMEFLRTYTMILGPIIDRLLTLREMIGAEEREERLGTIFTTASVGLSEIDVGGRFQRVNAELCRILGRSKDELLRLGVPEVTHPDDVPRSRDAVQEALATGRTISFDKRYLRPDGRPAWANSSVTPLPDVPKRPRSLLVVTVDLTARREAEAAVRESEERLRGAAQVGRLGLWDWDMRTDEVHWSDEHYRLEGYAVGEVMPSYEAWVARVHPDDRAHTEELLRAAQQGQGEFIHEYRTLHPDGAVRWLSARGRFFYDEAGAPIRMIGAMIDTTERRQWEEAQKVMVAELQHRTRNLIAVVRSIATETMKQTGPTETFRAVFSDRLSALSRVQGLLSRADVEPISIAALVRLELDALAVGTMGNRVTIAGPHVYLRNSTVQTLSLALHELATNARKYGALSHERGRLSVTWSERVADGERRLAIEWIESGLEHAPRRAQPVLGRGGFGRELIERALPHTLGASTVYNLTDTGVSCTIDLPSRPTPRNGTMS